MTSVPRTLLDSAPLLAHQDLRRALAEAEFLKLIDLEAIHDELGRGRPGSVALRAALDRHNPRLARTLSVLEERFLALCEAEDIPIPEVNADVCGLMVDTLWRAQRVVVELDGHAAHANPAAVERDRRRELTLRAGGFQVLRYTWQQIVQESERVLADLRTALSLRS